jgi:membrane-bound serine protease (ClpP class)
LAGWILIFILSVGLAGTAHAAGADVLVIRVADPIGPGVAEFIQDGIEKARQDNAACVVIELDTPGGLAESMRSIVQDILASSVPVVVYVAPAGARAASAGVMITMAADIAAMSPGTNIGAAHPVGAGGKDIEGKMSEKVINDMVAHAKSVAERRGRNAGWVEKAIRDSVSVTETEAVELDVVDLVAEDLDDLVQQLNGREITGKGVLRLDQPNIVYMEESLRIKILETIGNPNIAYILLLIGLAGLYFELSNPGAIFPGVIGGISLILAFFAMQMLPVNTVGILLIALAVILFVMEMKITSYGLLSVAGVVALSLGSLMLFENIPSGIGLSLRVMLPTLILVSGFFVFVAGLVFRAQKSKPKTGAGGLVGETGIVKQALTPEGKVLVHGELWNAVSKKNIDAGAKVRVAGVKGLVVEVEAIANDKGP